MSPRRRLATLGVAVGGVLAGHWLTYLAVSPSAHERAVILHDTGHSYLDLVSDIALVAALVAFASIFLSRLTKRSTDDGVSVTQRMIAFQVSAFLGMEVLERVATGAALAGLFQAHLLPLGIAAQIGVASLAAAAIRWLLRLADRVASLATGAEAPQRQVAAYALPTGAFAPTGRELFATGVRGPPTAL